MENLEFYALHNGTLKISGKTIPKDAATYAMDLMSKGVKQIEFFYVGANAGHQATKSMGVFRRLFEQSSGGLYTLAFVPRCFYTKTEDKINADKIASVWRTIVVPVAIAEKEVAGIAKQPRPEAPHATAGKVCALV